MIHEGDGHAWRVRSTAPRSYERTDIVKLAADIIPSQICGLTMDRGAPS